MTRKHWTRLLLERLADNVESVLEGVFLWLQFTLGGIIVGLILLFVWPYVEITNIWRIPLDLEF